MTGDTTKLIRDISDTALWVAAYRAEESERKQPLFSDPFARGLAGERGFEIARDVKSAFARVGARTNVVLRTVVIDELILDAARARRVDAVLNLAAGLDTRPYRLDLPNDLVWLEVDLPSLITSKEAALAEEAPACRLKRVPLDLTDRGLRSALLGRVATRFSRVLVLTEGLLGYLSPDMVDELAADLHASSAFAEWIADFASPDVRKGGMSAADGLASYASSALFAPPDGVAFFASRGWACAELRDVIGELPRLGRGRPLRTWTLERISAAFPKPEAGPRVMGVVRLVRSPDAARAGESIPTPAGSPDATA